MEPASISDSPNLPRLTIVVGRPGAGKTTLSRKLAERIHCPLITRDSIKEGLVNTSGDKGTPGGSLGWAAVETFFAVVELLVGRGVTLVAEAHFGRGLWEERIDRLKELAQVSLVVCEVDPELAHARVLQRRLEDPHWDQFHNSPVDQRQQPVLNYLPPDLHVSTLLVDCRDEYVPDLEAIYQFTR